MKKVMASHHQTGLSSDHQLGHAQKRERIDRNIYGINIGTFMLDKI